MVTLYSGAGFSKSPIGVIDGGVIYKGTGFGKVPIGEYSGGSIYRGTGWAKTCVGEYENGYVYRGYGFSKVTIGEYKDRTIYEGTGFSKTSIGSYDGEPAGAVAGALLLLRDELMGNNNPSGTATVQRPSTIGEPQQDTAFLPSENTHKENKWSRWYSDDDFKWFFPKDTFELNQAKDYFRYVGSYLLKNYRSEITEDEYLYDRVDAHYDGPFNLHKKKTETQVYVPTIGYWRLNREEDNYKGVDEWVEEESFINETGITPEGKIITVKYEERFYTQKYVMYERKTYNRFESEITELDVSGNPAQYIAMVDNLLRGKKLSFSQYLSNESEFIPDEREVAEYQSELKKRSEDIKKPLKVIDGKLNNWHWWAIIPLIPCLLAVNDRVRILFAVFFLIWLFVYPISHFRFQKINPKADNILYELIVLAALAVLEAVYLMTGFGGGSIRTNIYDLFFGGLTVCCFLASIYDKRHEKTDGTGVYSLRSGNMNEEESDKDENDKSLKALVKKLNRWHWFAMIPLILLTVTVADVTKILLTMLYLIWLVVYPLNRFKYRNINPKANNIFYEVVMIAGVLSIMAVSYIKDIRMFWYHPLFTACFVILMIVSAVEKLHLRGKRQE